jgi:hypothetical protein
MHCWTAYDFRDPASVITSINGPEVGALLTNLNPITFPNKDHFPGTQATIRFPLTASSWLGVVTNASKPNMDKWPKLDEQYRTLISNLVQNFTSSGVVVILDLVRQPA